MTLFSNYSDIIFDAFCLHQRQQEIVDRKREIIAQITEYYNLGTSSILFVGFNPAIFSIKSDNIAVAEVSDQVIEYLKKQKVKFTVFDPSNPKKYDIVVAVDEYLTFAESDEVQQQQIQYLCTLANRLVITTVKDYKNQEFKDREYSQPAMIKANNQLTAFVEIHDWSQEEKHVWNTAVYKLQGAKSTAMGIYQRRALFFKQLAKFSMDAGATNFLVHKNIMFKSLIKKNYEHVISIEFDF